MIVWVNEVLATYIVMAPDHVVPVLILEPMPHDGIGSVYDPGARRGGKAYPRRMHVSQPACGCRL